jgi:NitT/TauT family transport system permease protein
VRLVRGAAGILLVIAASEALGRAGIVDQDYLPPASTILRRAGELVMDAEFRTDVRATLVAWALGLLVATGIAVPLGLTLGTIPPIARAITTIVEFLRPIPSVALIPLVAMLLGSGLEMKLTVIVYASVWPILFNTVYGLRDVDPVARDTLRAFGFGRLEVLWRVAIPATAPFVATGIRIAAAVALILTVTTEMFGGFGDGIGIFIAQASNYPGGIDDTLAATVWAGMLGLLINGLLRRGELRLFHWAYRDGVPG